MALGSLLLEPRAAVGVVGGTTGDLGVSAKDTAGAAQALPSLTFFTSDAGIAAISAQAGAYLTVTVVGAGSCLVWCSDGGVILSNKVLIETSDPNSGTSRRQMRGGGR